ncbi:hypothetical protein BS47DRAFT_1372825 [Hydnum rufescens UP504]|uniref:Threonylcarbamoyl-AMP synthase n=1 Tax=Hydnum rufescens UP504 TaxID=1448309 RepID=A0A9P6AV86_9AGAM|nr:hypothetical protein BS47DRAFT_1372825 [Hydnum rufescens UP504]
MATAGAQTTQVLQCDPLSITFSKDINTNEISSPSTLSSLVAASLRLKNDLEPIAFPTETVYGLGALALSNPAVLRIFATKGRPADNPLIVHVSSLSMLRRILPPDYIVPQTYTTLINAFWPGPLTLLFPSSSLIPPAVTAGHETVAVRMPSHPVARALIALCDEPLAAPSANSSGKPSPTRAEHVARDLGGKISIILDGGPADVGLESTVVDGLAPDGHLRVLRPGGVTVEDIQKLFPAGAKDNGTDTDADADAMEIDFADDAMEAAPTTPGMKYRHYAPSVPVVLLVPLPTASDSNSTPSLNSLPSASSQRIAILSHTLGSLSTPHITAQRLFDGLLTLDDSGADLILVESVEESREGLAIMNRVRKAAGETRWIDLDR